MRKATLFLLFMLLGILLTGAISKHYVHVQMADESAVITLFTKTAVLGSIDYEKVAEICKKKPEYSCLIDKENFSISITTSKGGEYYSFSTDYSFPFNLYTLEIRKIPADLLAKKTQLLLQEAGESPSAIEIEPMDITKKDAQLSQFLKNRGDIRYVVVMPGDIISANIGEKNGNSLFFMLSQAYGQEGSIIVKSTQLNTSLIVAILMLLVLIAVALFFFNKKKEKVESHTVETKRARSKRR